MTIENQFTVFGGYSVGVTPVLISNTEVKSYSADDTALETMWESRSPPKLFVKAPYSANEEPFYSQSMTASLERNFKEYWRDKFVSVLVEANSTEKEFKKSKKRDWLRGVRLVITHLRSTTQGPRRRLWLCGKKKIKKRLTVRADLDRVLACRQRAAGKKRGLWKLNNRCLKELVRVQVNWTN